MLTSVSCQFKRLSNITYVPLFLLLDSKTSAFKLPDRFGVSFVCILIPSLKNLSSDSLTPLNFVEVAVVQILFIKDDMKCRTYILFFHVSLKSPSNMFMKTRFRFQIRCLIFRLAILVNYFPKINAENLQKSSKLSEIKMLFWGGRGGGG